MEKYHSNYNVQNPTASSLECEQVRDMFFSTESSFAITMPNNSDIWDIIHAKEADMHNSQSNLQACHSKDVYELIFK